MKKLLLIFACVLPLCVRAEPPPALLTAAVIDFQTSGEKFGKKGAEVAVLLSAQFSAAPSLILVERQELEKLLGEQELGLAGNVTPDTAAKVGALTGAKILVTGRLFDAGEKFFLVAKIMSTETSRVYGETTTFTDLRALDTATTELAGKILNVIEKRADTLVAKVEDSAVRLACWRQLLAGKKLPSVSVRIAEQHLNRAVIDPAAETEIKLVLQQLGFDLLDAPTVPKAPDIVVSGEAFSELGARRGNLVSCLARIEIKVARRDPAQILLVDRQRDVAVDVAENVAGKSALQNAALKLLDRIIPALIP